GIRDIVMNMIQSAVDRVVSIHTQDPDEDKWDYESIVDYVHGNLFDEGTYTVNDFKGLTSDEIVNHIMEKVNEHYDEKTEELGEEQMHEFEKVVVLRAVDTKWMDHIDQMDQLRQGIHLRAYGQNDPLREYQMEGYNMFEEMVANIEQDVARYVMKAQIRQNLQREEVAKGAKAVSGESEATKVRKPIVKKQTVGRNDPCPCGSGKKFKHCHGKNE